MNDDYIEDDVSRSLFSKPRSWSTEGGLQPTVIVNLPNLAVNSVIWSNVIWLTILLVPGLLKLTLAVVCRAFERKKNRCENLVLLLFLYQNTEKNF